MAIPAGAHHAWKNRSARPLRMLALFSPGGAEFLFEQLAGRSPEEIAAFAETYGTYIVGSPIEG